MEHRHRQRGFTLVEQIITLAVAAILVSIAIPSMAHLMTRSATRTTEDALFAAAHLARTQAIMHNTHALLCPSVDGRHCSHDTDWEQGWIVALDKNRDNRVDTAILSHDMPDTHHVDLIGSRGRTHVRFRADGSAAGTNLTLLICPHGTDDGEARTVVISNVGRIREAPASRERRESCPAAS